jgi:hypothetical protein
MRADKCHVCRKRKVKCGAERPSCLRCLRANLTCTGYHRALDIRVVSVNDPANFVGLAKNYAEANTPAQDYRTCLTENQIAKLSLSSQLKSATLSLDSSYIRVGAASQYIEAFLGKLQELYFPDSVRLSAGNNALVPAVCSTWLHSACNLASQQGPNSLRKFTPRPRCGYHGI